MVLRVEVHGHIGTEGSSQGSWYQAHDVLSIMSDSGLGCYRETASLARFVCLTLLALRWFPASGGRRKPACIFSFRFVFPIPHDNLAIDQSVSPSPQARSPPCQPPGPPCQNPVVFSWVAGTKETTPKPDRPRVVASQNSPLVKATQVTLVAGTCPLHQFDGRSLHGRP